MLEPHLFLAIASLQFSLGWPVLLLCTLQAHIFSACPEVEVGCQYGNCQAFMARKLLAEHHATSCQEFEVDCIAGCGEKVYQIL